MYEFMNGNLHYCPFLCHFIYCMPFWKIANVNVCFLRSFWRFLKERMESCSNSKVLEEFSCRHSKRRCFTKNNKNNIKKLKKQIHCSTTNTHTNKKKRSTNKKKHVLPFTLILTLQPPSTPPPTQPLFNQPPRPPRSLQVENCWNHRCRWESGEGQTGSCEECCFPVDDTLDGRNPANQLRLTGFIHHPRWENAQDYGSNHQQ